MTTPTVQPVQPPPQDDETIKQVAELLLAGYAIDKTAHGVAHLLGLPTLPVLAAIGLAGSGTAHRPNARLAGTQGARTAGPVREVRDQETFYRAAYVVNAAARIHASMSSGQTLKQAVSTERPNTRAHEQARRNRLNTAVEMQRLSDLFGPLLGWYRDPLSDSESECVQADGHNFDPAVGTVIGFPGSVHPHCRCVAGPPIDDGGMVNDYVSLESAHNHTYKLKAHSETHAGRRSGHSSRAR